MSFLEDVNLNDVVEPHTVPGGEEYRIRIVDIKKDENGELPLNKNGNRYILPTFEIPDEVGAQNFTTYIGLPSNDMSEKDKNNTKYRIKQFLQCFGFDTPPDDPVELIGAEGYAILGEKSDPEYGDQNTIRRFLTQR